MCTNADARLRSPSRPGTRLQGSALTAEQEHRREASRLAAKARKERADAEKHEAAVAKVLSGEGSKKKRDMKAQKAQEARTRFLAPACRLLSLTPLDRNG